MIARRAELRDASGMARLHGRAFEKSWSKSDFETWMRRDHAFGVVVERGSRLVAIGFAMAAGDDAELLTIASSPAARRRGGASAALFQLDVEAQKRGLNRWVLEVACNNAPARALYDRLKFVEIGVRKGYYSAGPDHFDGFVLARPVGMAPVAAGGHGSD